MQRLLLVTVAVAFVTSAAAGVRATSGRSTFSWPDNARAALSLSFDDARDSQVETGLPLFERLGVRVTFYVVSERVAGRPDAWRAALRAGHEIGNHSRQHPCSGNFLWAKERALEAYTLAGMREELTGANRQIRDVLGVTPRTFAYPCGQTFVGRGVGTASYVPLVAELFEAGRGWLDEAPNDPAYVDLAQVFAVSMDDATPEQLRPMLDRAAAAGAWLVLGGHDIGAEAGPQVTRVAAIEGVVAWARDPSRRIWVDTVGNVARYVRTRQSSPPGAPRGR